MILRNGISLDINKFKAYLSLVDCYWKYMVEIERKFLVRSKAYRSLAISNQRIFQGFLNTHPERTVRVRLLKEKGYLTIKGKSNLTGTTRYEWEQEISVDDAHKLMEICEPDIIDKTRYVVPFGGHVFEVDVFQGDNKGLIVAEVELNEEKESFLKPDWLGMEVTGDLKYYNSNLSKTPFKMWSS